MLKGFILGVAAAIAAGLFGAYVFVSMGWMPANADSPPPALEKWAARRSLRATIRREMPQGAGPLSPTDNNLLAGAKIYKANCAVCHGAADGKPSTIAQGLYQVAPQLARHGVTDDPEGKIYWKVRHGIRLTGMPGFSRTLSDTELWQVTLFLKHLDSLTPGAAAEWKRLPSQAPSTKGFSKSGRGS